MPGRLGILSAWQRSPLEDAAPCRFFRLLSCRWKRGREGEEDGSRSSQSSYCVITFFGRPRGRTSTRQGNDSRPLLPFPFSDILHQRKERARRNHDNASKWVKHEEVCVSCDDIGVEHHSQLSRHSAATPNRRASARRGGVLADLVHDGLKRFSRRRRNGQVSQAKIEQQLDLALLFRRDLPKGPCRFFANFNGESGRGHKSAPLLCELRTSVYPHNLLASTPSRAYAGGHVERLVANRGLLTGDGAAGRLADVRPRNYRDRIVGYNSIRFRILEGKEGELVETANFDHILKTLKERKPYRPFTVALASGNRLRSITQMPW